MSTPAQVGPARSREEALRRLELRAYALLPATVPAIAAAVGVSEGAMRAIVRRLRRTGDVRVVSRVPLVAGGPVWGRRGIAVYGRVERSA